MDEKLRTLAHLHKVEWAVRPYDADEIVIVHQGNNISSGLMDGLRDVCKNHTFSIMAKPLELWICINKKS